MKERRAPPPQLMFDDGSRIMMAEQETEAIPVESSQSIRGSIPIETYYEIDRITNEILAMTESRKAIETKEEENQKNQNHLLRVALQFPDALLVDSPDVCWLLEERISERTMATPLVFCLGDTTVGSCCPDEVAALHLQADVLVHYGHACLSPTGTLPVIYSFGMLEINVNKAVQSIGTQQQQEQGDSSSQKFLLLYQVGYHHAMEELQAKLTEQGNASVVAGQIPKPQSANAKVKQTTQTKSCCGKNEDPCCSQQDSTSMSKSVAVSDDLQAAPIQQNPDTAVAQDDKEPIQQQQRRRPMILGGLELPESIDSWDQLSDYTILFVGDSESTSQRQYTNIMLRFLSLAHPPNAYWTYSPKTETLTTSLPSYLQRQLKRRFFLSQKARDAHVFGVLVSNLSQQHLIDVVKSLKRRITDAGKSSYSFAVGKINPAKLANFAEIECFVLVACREHSLLSEEREYHVPVITPLELEIALDNKAWGSQSYSLDCQDVLDFDMPQQQQKKDSEEEEDDEDAPYFSLVTGKYAQRSSTTSGPLTLDLENLPGKGQVTAYKSEAANFLKQREYQGLTTMAGETDVKAAIPGQKGIASDYGGS